MPADPIGATTDPDGLVRELYEAAYRFAVRHRFDGTFDEVAIAVRDALRTCAGEGSMTSHWPRRGPGPSSGPRLPGPTLT
jgi:hypothetical protein